MDGPWLTVPFISRAEHCSEGPVESCFRPGFCKEASAASELWWGPLQGIFLQRDSAQGPNSDRPLTFCFAEGPGRLGCTHRWPARGSRGAQPKRGRTEPVSCAAAQQRAGEG